jgi:hypothetical protein
VKEKKMGTTAGTKPGRLTDSKWWFCVIGQHDKCAVEIELSSRFEGCPCECHQKAAPQPAPDAGGEWRIVNPDGAVVRIVAGENDTITTVTGETRAERQLKAAQIISNHKQAAAVPKLVEALQRRVSPTKCYCEVMLGAKCGECVDRELLHLLALLLRRNSYGK